MKVLLTCEWFSPVINGVVISVENLQKELKKLGHEVRILTLSETQQSFQKDNITYISSIGAGRIYPGVRFSLPINNQYFEELVSWHPDIIHSQCEFSTFLMARRIARKLQVPIVHTYHTVYEDYTHYFSPNKKIGKAMAASFTKKTLQYADCVIVPTDKVRSLLLEYGVAQEIEVVPTGIDLERFDVLADKHEKQRLREKLGIPYNDKVLVSVGRLAKEKNLEEILLFFSQLKRDDLKLLIVGDGPYRQELEKYAVALGISEDVIFTGMVSPREVDIYYQLGDVFVSASNSETQGLTYVEALANGVPGLCRKDSCLKNVIIDGINGWQYKSFGEFKDKLYFMLDQEEQYEILSKKARTGAIQEYSSESFGKKVENIYLNTIHMH